MGKRRIPTHEECITGIPIVLANAAAHLRGADTLAHEGQYGFAVAHLINALEECEKARTLGKVVLGASMTEDEIKSGLYERRDRHIGAMVKSVSTGGALLEFVAESLSESVGLRPERTEAELWADVNSRHPEVLPVDWPETAGDTRVRNLYVDLQDAGWRSPAETEAENFERLRPAVVGMLDYIEAAFQLEVVPLADCNTPAADR